MFQMKDKKTQDDSQSKVTVFFENMAIQLPKLLEEWCDLHKTKFGDTRIPLHYNVLELRAPIKSDHTLKIQLVRTVTCGNAKYSKADTIMETFKRIDMIVEKNGTVRAYDLHGRYDKNTKKYYLLKCDAKRLKEIDRIFDAMPFIDKKLTDRISLMKPLAVKHQYAKILEFSIPKK